MESRLSAPNRETLLERAFHGSTMGMAVTRLSDGSILEANDAFCYLLGSGVGDLLGTTTFELGLWSEMGPQRAQRLLEGRGVIDGFDTTVVTPSGEKRVLRLWAEVVHASGEEPLAVIRASDIDGRTSAGSRYAELREAEVRYRALVEQIPAITYTQVEDPTSPTGFRDVYISPQTERILGYAIDEWITDPELWIRATHPEDRDRVVGLDRRSARSGSRFRCEYRMIARGGKVVWFRDEAELVEDPVTGLSFWQGVMMDVTELREAEEQHAEVEAKYRTLIEQIPAIVYVGEYGEEGDWLYISPQLERVLGFTPEEWMAHPHPMASFTHPEDLPGFREIEERSRETGEDLHAEVRMLTKDGRWKWILHEATDVKDESGRPFVMQGVMYDMTERKHSEQALAMALERLRGLDALKNTLLHTLSHDLKEPLTAILGAASTLERLGDGLPSEERHTLLKTLAARSKGMSALLSDLLDLDRLDQGIVEPRRFPVDLEELTLGLVGRTDALRDRVVETRTEHVTLSIDAAKVERMLENLLTNAAKHTPERAHIWVNVERTQGGALLSVEDDGPGVPDEHKETIFEAFRRGTSAAPGSGIGLSLVARFAELHGGRAWVQDRNGGGSSFRIFLPNVPT